MIPKGWGNHKFDDVTNAITCGWAATPKYVEQDVGYPFLSAQNVQNGKVDLSKYKYVTQELHEKLRKNNPPKKGDLLYSRVGAGFGNAAIVDVEFDFSIYVSLTLIKVKSEILNNNYCLQLLNSPICKNQAKNGIFAGGGVPNLNISVIKNFTFNLPPIPEQLKIAKVLSTWDAAIEKLEKLIEAKKLRKKGLMQQLLTGKKRFDGFDENWKEYNLSKIAKITAGGTPSTKRPEYWGGEIPWMNSGDINRKFVKGVDGRITEEGMNKSSTKIIPKHSVLMALAGQGKTRGTVAINEIDLCTNQSLAAVILKEDFYYRFIYYYLDSQYEQIRRLSTGDGGRGGLNLKIISSIKISIPHIDEQMRIGDFFFDIDVELQQLEKKKSLINLQKKGLMQQLLTGKKRVKVD